MGAGQVLRFLFFLLLLFMALFIQVLRFRDSASLDYFKYRYYSRLSLPILQPMNPSDKYKTLMLFFNVI